MKILHLDIETTPILAYTWGLWDQNIGINQIVKTTEMMCFGARWNDKKQVIFKSAFHDGKEAMLNELHALMNEADVLVGWNSAAFDHKHINREFLEAGLRPPSPTKDLDLMSVVKSNFKFPSNKLDYVAQQLGVGAKVKHSGFDLWLKCMDNDSKAWAEMKKYQIQDVNLLVDLYPILLPWADGPNLAAYNGLETSCVACGSVNIEESGVSVGTTGTYPRYVCNDCGSWSRSTKNNFTTNVTNA
jgi:uncharacterized protein YprB with RNaseH-like and TPR domain